MLAGGRSSRMGRDKARLPFRGAPLVDTIARVVAEAAGSAVLVGPAELTAWAGFPRISDLYPGEGPLGGILTALHHTAATWNLIAACDMPSLTGPFLSDLLAAAEDSGADALLPHGPSGRPEPLCAVYRRDALAGLEAAFAAGVRKITAALAGLRAVPYPVAEVSWLANVNTPEEWLLYAAE